MTKRRGHGDGGIYKRKDGFWAASVELGWDQGKRRRKVIYGKTRREVADRLGQLKHDHRIGKPLVDDRRQLSTFLTEWLEDVVTPTVRPRTTEAYRWAVNHHIVPAIGNVTLAKLNASHVQKLISEKVKSDLSDRSVEFIWQVLRRALKVAMRWGLVTQNVAELATPPRPTHKEVRTFTVEEIRSIIKASLGHHDEAVFVLALTCGLRRGEILGLRWSDLDLDADPAKLSVQNTLQRINGALVQGPPKSAKSRRVISLSVTARDALRRRRTAQRRERLVAGPAWEDTGLVFTKALGAPCEPTTVLKSWHDHLESVGLKKEPLHNARHAAASLMLSEGVPLKVVSETLGHSTIRLTADTYGHLMPGDSDRAAEAMNRALGGSS